MTPSTDYCECDNTHEQNDTVCQWCWSKGRRHWNDSDVEINAVPEEDNNS